MNGEGVKGTVEYRSPQGEDMPRKPLDAFVVTHAPWLGVGWRFSPRPLPRGEQPPEGRRRRSFPPFPSPAGRHKEHPRCVQVLARVD